MRFSSEWAIFTHRLCEKLQSGHSFQDWLGLRPLRSETDHLEGTQEDDHEDKKKQGAALALL